MTKRKKTDYVQFKIRLRESLRKRLEDTARAKDASLNSEMVSRLEQSLTAASIRDEIQGELRKITERLDQLIEQRREPPSYLSDLFEDIEPPGADSDETAEERQARWLAMAEDQRKSADADDARGAHDMAAHGREWADELERNAREIAHQPWSWPPREMAERLTAALGRTATGKEISVAMKLAESRRLPPNPDHWEAALKAVTTMLGRLAQLRSEPEREPELPMPQPRELPMPQPPRRQAK